MNKNLELMAASDLTNLELESLCLEVWLKTEQLLRLGRYKKKGWRVTVMDSVEISWEDFLEIVEEFKRFVPGEEEAIRREKEDAADSY